MSKAKVLPDDVRSICIQIVRGYDRRVREYYDRRREIIDGTACHYEVIGDPADETSEWFYSPHSSGASRTTENVADRLLHLEDLPETKRMRAVEQAKLQIGLDLPEEFRRKLADAIILNCKAGRRYPYEYLDVPGIERTNFYDRRTAFLANIARYLKMI